jgi:hypothetical protein
MTWLAPRTNAAQDGSMWRRAAVGLVIIAIVAAGVSGIVGSIDDPTAAPGREPVSSLFVEPNGADSNACGEYVATWLDLLHAENAFPIDELKADVGQGPLRVAVTDIWRRAVDLESRFSREEVAQRLVPEIAAACEDPDVRAQLAQLRSN